MVSEQKPAEMRIGHYLISPNLILAPMAGVTDKPFRMLCKKMGAGLCVSEMTISDPRFWRTSKSVHRMDHSDEPSPISVQIAGTDPVQLAEAARFNVDHGAQIIDINMGCPAKKVCNVLAGSALMRDEKLVAGILSATVKAVDVPVTLKIRTGWSPDSRNALAIARIAEDCGIQSLAIHGRTRQDFYTGLAEYDTIAEVKQALRIPVVANGDISDPIKAKFVLEYTKADALMIGRAAQGRPWIFRHIQHYLETGELLPEPPVSFIADTLLGHLRQLHEFYGEPQGVRIARKHLGWYSAAQEHATEFRSRVNKAETASEQVAITEDFFAGLAA
jgi:tRNA-dihydrouridine synthase B